MQRLVYAGLFMLVAASCGDQQGAPQTEDNDRPQEVAQDMPDHNGGSGRELFNYWCQPCHGAGPGHAGTQQLARRLGEDQSVLLERDNLTPEYVRHVVRNGFQMMPPFRHTEISEAELDNIAAYVADSEE